MDIYRPNRFRFIPGQVPVANLGARSLVLLACCDTTCDTTGIRWWVDFMENLMENLMENPMKNPMKPPFMENPIKNG